MSRHAAAASALCNTSASHEPVCTYMRVGAGRSAPARSTANAIVEVAEMPIERDPTRGTDQGPAASKRRHVVAELAKTQSKSHFLQPAGRVDAVRPEAQQLARHRATAVLLARPTV